MMTAPMLEIRVAFIGNVSAGKTMAINALLREKFGEVAMNRTTACVNHFRITTALKENEPTEWAMAADNPRTAESTLEEIVIDNVKLRESSSVKEKTFDVELKEEICKMRPGTKLVVVDVPGLNEADTQQRYRDWVDANWETFHYVVVVMDGQHGVNSEEQVSLLKFVKSKMDERKAVRVVILCNKIDDPEDEEVAGLVREARVEVENIFEVDDRVSGLEDLLARAESGDTSDLPEGTFPVFVPISAMTGFIFRSSSIMTLEKFRKLDKNLIAKLGQEGIAKSKWRKMAAEEQIKTAFAVISDSDNCKEGLAESNFDTFLKILGHTCGGANLQQQMIESKIELCRDALTHATGFAKRLRSIHLMTTALSASSSKNGLSASQKLFCVKKRFWELCYCLFTQEVGWGDETQKAVHHLKMLVKKQLAVVASKRSEVDSDTAAPPACADDVITWKQLSGFDWSRILGSILLLASQSLFCEAFGAQKIALEALYTGLLARFAELRPRCPEHGCELTFNRFCTQCRRYMVPMTKTQWSSIGTASFASYCPRYPQCQYNGYPFANGHVINCSCGLHLRWFDCFPPETRNFALWCPSCRTGLDFNRWCKSCDVVYCPPGTLADNKCPNHKGNNLCGSKCNQGCGNDTPFKELPAHSVAVEVDDAMLYPLDKDTAKLFAHLHVPDSLSDPDHFGHVAWKYCMLMSSLDCK